MQPKRIACLAREAADEKQARDPLILGVSKLTSLARYFLIMHGNSDRQVRAIAQNVMEVLKKRRVPLWHEEGMESGTWVLLDYGSVMIHVFHRETREFYSLERLWGDANRI